MFTACFVIVDYCMTKKRLFIFYFIFYFAHVIIYYFKKTVDFSLRSYYESHQNNFLVSNMLVPL